MSIELHNKAIPKQPRTIMRSSLKGLLKGLMKAPYWGPQLEVEETDPQNFRMVDILVWTVDISTVFILQQRGHVPLNPTCDWLLFVPSL